MHMSEIMGEPQNPRPTKPKDLVEYINPIFKKQAIADGQTLVCEHQAKFGQWLKEIHGSKTIHPPLVPCHNQENQWLCQTWLMKRNIWEPLFQTQIY